MATATLTRRSFCVCSSAAGGLSAQEVLAGTAADADDAPLLRLCALHTSLNFVVLNLWGSHMEEYDRTIAQIGECPRGFNATWHTHYRQSAAWRSEDAHQQACDRQDQLMDQIVTTCAVTIAGVAAKLDLWRRTNHDYLDGNDVLWNSVVDDIKALCGGLSPTHRKRRQRRKAAPAAKSGASGEKRRQRRKKM
jgi:hypothetical protein